MSMTSDSSATILVVEDEPATRAMLSSYLSDAGYAVHQAQDGAAFKQAIADHDIDLVLLDIRLPDADGLALARGLRKRSDIGIIFISSLDEELDRVVGLELGADDYITKPVSMREMLARVRNALRRLQPAPRTQERVIRLGDWEVDLVRREVVGRDARPLPLTRGEFDLLAAMVEANGRPVSRDYLLDVISGRSLDVSDRTVDTLVSRIRKKIESEPARPTLLLTERGIGYRVVLRRR